MISLIASLSRNYVIGRKNSIPWNLPSDLSWFKYNTLNKPIIMGRLTWESIGYPLPKRKNIVISSQPINNNYIQWVKSINEAIHVCNGAKEIMIIGGELIYTQFISIAHRLYLTHIDIEVTGDAYFPNYDLNEWKQIFNKFYNANKQNSHNYRFEILKRI